MSDFHKRKEAERANKKLVFSQKSLDEWKAGQEAKIKENVKKDVMEEIEKRLKEENEKIADAWKALEAKKEEITEEAIDQAFILMIGIPIKVMYDKYGWRKKKRLPQLGEYITEYYAEFQNGDMTIKDYQKLIWEEAGVGFTLADEDEDTDEKVKHYEEWLNEMKE